MRRFGRVKMRHFTATKKSVMDKDIKVCNKKQTNPTKNIIEYDIFNKDKNYILSLLSIEYGLSFEGAKCVQTDSIAIHKNGASWFVKKFNDTKYPNLPPYANFEGLVYALTNHIQDGKERAKKQGEFIARCNGLVLPPTNVPTQNKPNTRKSENKGLNVEFCDLTNEALEYFAAKGGISKQTLERYGIRSVDRLFGRAEFYPSFGWNVGDNVKVKRPLHPSKKYAQSKGFAPYIFGWEQLPTQGKDLVICAGETDCLCINEHCNSIGVFAICLNTENDKKTITSELASELKSRFKRVFVLYDADSIGVSNSRELAVNFGFIWVNIAVYLGNEKDKDVCNIYANAGASGVVEFIQHATNFHTNIKAVPTDIHSIEVPFVYQLEFTQYLGEKQPLETIKSLLMCESRLAIQSPAGTGKSTMIQALCSPENNGKNFVFNALGIDKTIVATPTTAIALQLQKDFEKRGVSCSILYGEILGYDLEISRLDSLVITTYRSLEKLTEFIPNSLLIIDEFHQIANDYDYTNYEEKETKLTKYVMSEVWDAMQKAPNILLLSATPNYLFCSHFEEFFNYALLVCYPKFTNQIRLNILEHTTSKKYLIDYIEENAPLQGGTICIKYDSNNTLKTYYENDLKRGLLAEHFTSQNRDRKEENDNYNSIMETGKPTQKLDRLYFTTLLEAGVSLKFPIDLVAIFDVKSWSKIVQLATRPRLCEDGGKLVNSVVNVWVFNSQNRKKTTTPNNQTIRERWAKYYTDAIKNVNYFNGTSGGEIDHKTSTDFRNFVMKTGENWAVDVPAILHELFKQETSETDLQTLIERIARFDPRFEIEYVEHINAVENADISAALEQAKADKEKAQIQLFELLKNEPTNTVHALCKLSKDKELKADVKRVLGLPIADKETINDLIKTNAPAFGTGETNRLLKDLVFMVGDLGDTLQNAITKIAVSSKKELRLERDTHQRKERIKTYKNSPKDQSPKARLEVEREKAISLKFKYILNNIQKGRRKNEFTAIELAKLVNDALGGLVIDGKEVSTPKKIGEKAVINYLSQFYEITNKQTRDKDGKHIYIYSILKTKKLG